MVSPSPARRRPSGRRFAVLLLRVAFRLDAEPFRDRGCRRSRRRGGVQASPRPRGASARRPRPRPRSRPRRRPRPVPPSTRPEPRGARELLFPDPPDGAERDPFLRPWGAAFESRTPRRSRSRAAATPSRPHRTRSRGPPRARAREPTRARFGTAARAGSPPRGVARATRARRAATPRIGRAIAADRRCRRAARPRVVRDRRSLPPRDPAPRRASPTRSSWPGTNGTRRFRTWARCGTEATPRRPSAARRSAERRRGFEAGRAEPEPVCDAEPILGAFGAKRKRRVPEPVPKGQRRCDESDERERQRQRERGDDERYDERSSFSGDPGVRVPLRERFQRRHRAQTQTPTRAQTQTPTPTRTPRRLAPRTPSRRATRPRRPSCSSPSANANSNANANANANASPFVFPSPSANGAASPAPRRRRRSCSPPRTRTRTRRPRPEPPGAVRLALPERERKRERERADPGADRLPSPAPVAGTPEGGTNDANAAPAAEAARIAAVKVNESPYGASLATLVGARSPDPDRSSDANANANANANAKNITRRASRPRGSRRRATRSPSRVTPPLSPPVSLSRAPLFALKPRGAPLVSRETWTLKPRSDPRRLIVRSDDDGRRRAFVFFAFCVVVAALELAETDAETDAETERVPPTIPSERERVRPVEIPVRPNPNRTVLVRRRRGTIRSYPAREGGGYAVTVVPAFEDSSSGYVKKWARGERNGFA